MKAIPAALIAILLLFSACPKSAPDYPPLTVPEISGDRLWKRISVEADHDDYPGWPGLEGIQLGQSPHGRYHTIYINPVLHNALPVASRIAPEGSIIVKENFDAEKNSVGYTVMAKVKGFNLGAGDWYWASYDPSGKTLAAGALGMCIGCHGGMKPNDYVIVRALDRPLPGPDR